MAYEYAWHQNHAMISVKDFEETPFVADACIHPDLLALCCHSSYLDSGSHANRL